MISMAQQQADGFLRTLAGKLIHRIVQSPAVFFYARTHFYWGTMTHLRRALNLQPGERLLDVGCGSGMGAGLTRGTYVGIDTELPYLRFARTRLRGWLTHSFIGMSVLELGFRDEAFDKAMILNVLHHLDEAFIDQFMIQLTRVVRKKVFVLDHDIERDNAVSGWLVKQDRGAYMRPCGELQRILEHHYEVEQCERFYNNERTIAHVLFTLVPRRHTR